jgi:hypothetical protein
VIFSYDERKAGSYFGADLFEKCIAVDETAAGYDVNVNIPDAKTMVDAVFFTEADESGRKFVSNALTSRSFSDYKGYNLSMYDYESEEYPAAVEIVGENHFVCKGILKVQYTK